MKKVALAMAFVFLAGMAHAGTKASSSTAKKPRAKAEVVSVDETAKTITAKVDGRETTTPVEGMAVAKLKTLKPGSKVVLVYRDNDKGEHEAVTAIRMDMGKSKAKASSSSSATETK